jgi:hypothetical protein
LPPRFRYESWKAFSDGGEIQWIKDPELLGIISEAYYAMRILMELSHSLFSITNQSTISSELTLPVNKLIRSDIGQQSINTIAAIKKALENLNSQLGF